MAFDLLIYRGALFAAFFMLGWLLVWSAQEDRIKPRILTIEQCYVWSDGYVQCRQKETDV